MKRKVVASILTMAMIMSLSGCGSESTQSNSAAGEVAATQEVASEAATIESAVEVKVNSEDDFRVDDEDGKIVIIGYEGESMDVVIPSTIDGKEVVAIGRCAFVNDDITSVVCPDTLKEIREEAFENCDCLTDIQFNDGLESVGRLAFNCASLEKVILPDSVTFVDEIAFLCPGTIMEIKLSNSMTEIPSGCFGCAGVSSITVPAYIKSVGKQAFYGCKNLETLVFEEGVEVLGEDVFEDCDALTSVVIPASVTEIQEISSYDCENIVFTVPAGSYAEQYMQENELNYVTQ